MILVLFFFAVLFVLAVVVLLGAFAAAQSSYEYEFDRCWS